MLTTGISFDTIKSFSHCYEDLNDGICVFCGEWCSEKSIKDNKYVILDGNLLKNTDKYVCLHVCLECHSENNDFINEGEMVKLTNFDTFHIKKIEERKNF